MECYYYTASDQRRDCGGRSDCCRLARKANAVRPLYVRFECAIQHCKECNDTPCWEHVGIHSLIELMEDVGKNQSNYVVIPSNVVIPATIPHVVAGTVMLSLGDRSAALCAEVVPMLVMSGFVVARAKPIKHGVA